MPGEIPAISVVMPVYNRADGVHEAIGSVLEQDFTDFELIVVDDGSDDGTNDVIRQMRDARIRCFRQPQNMGGNAARNRGIRAARAPLITFLDSDDRFLPNKLGFVSRFFAENPKIDVLIDSFRLVHPPETGRPAVERRNPELRSSAEVERAVFSRTLYKATPALSARRQALVAVGLFDESLTRRQDMDLLLRLVRSAHCASTSEILWTKRWSKDSISAKQETFVKAVIEICTHHPDYLVRPEFRSGLARDIARHFLRLAARGRIGTVRADLGRCVRFFGWREVAGLLGAGMVETIRRKRARHSR